MDVVIARPSSDAVRALGTARDMLEQFPILDEELLGQYLEEEVTADAG
jgi:hypothetical protein